MPERSRHGRQGAKKECKGLATAGLHELPVPHPGCGHLLLRHHAPAVVDRPGKPRYTGDRCEGCALRAYASIKKTIEQVKRDTSDLFETVGCLSVEHVTGRYDLVSTLELIAESISTSTCKAGELSLQVREIQRTNDSVAANPTRPTEAVKVSLAAPAPARPKRLPRPRSPEGVEPFA